MANYKRKRPKEYTNRYCGYRSCKQDKTRYHGNGRNRYLSSLWKKLGGRKAWRYNDVG